jgi:D-serine deaminase-like pyridoxal phosphate-dependent protein
MQKPRSIFDLPTPALLLDWPTAKRNIQQAADFVQDKHARLRPHFKSHKCVPLAREQLAAGGCVGITTATVEEAAVLVDSGVEDVLVASQVAGEAKLERLVQVAQKATVRVIVDDESNARPLGDAASKAGSEVGVLLEVDIGNHRCGAPPGAATLTRVRDLLKIPGIRFDGLHAYHGHVVNMFDLSKRDAAAQETMQHAIDTRRLLESEGIACPILSGAGASTYHIVGEMEGVDELQIGTYVTMDWSYKQRAPQFDIALTVLATVISAQQDHFVVDVGVKGVAHEYGPPQVLDHPELEIPIFRGEENTVVRGANHGKKVGDRVHISPSHGCATCNLHQQMVIREGDEVKEVWPISARGYGL